MQNVQAECQRMLDRLNQQILSARQHTSLPNKNSTSKKRNTSKQEAEPTTLQQQVKNSSKGISNAAGLPPPHQRVGSSSTFNFELVDKHTTPGGSEQSHQKLDDIKAKYQNKNATINPEGGKRLSPVHHERKRPHYLPDDSESSPIQPPSSISDHYGYQQQPLQQYHHPQMINECISLPYTSSSHVNEQTKHGQQTSNGLTTNDEIVSYSMEEEEEDDSGYMIGGQTMMMHEAQAAQDSMQRIQQTISMKRSAE
ncbi:hypothetical protein FGO68_gene10783 [Halteria grandinella]|uniref:Uncharacterized protein n=1 Tax=Halteria grandinella TaxID=5974 RepID=A0A8J8NCW0_HALGN|nr:hypothetical protein FGO68_gene10783 [Halteria grandinella]